MSEGQSLSGKINLKLKRIKVKVKIKIKNYINDFSRGQFSILMVDTIAKDISSG